MKMLTGRSPGVSVGGGSAALCAALVLCLAAPAHGQLINTGDSSNRPFRPLFGGASADGPQGPQSLILTASVFGGYDDDIFARGTTPGSSGPGRPRVAGQFIGSQASLNYQRRFATATLTGSAATANRYVSDTGDFLNTFAAASVGIQGSASARTTYMANQSVGYRPFFTPSTFPAPSTVGPSVGGELEGADPNQVGGLESPDDFTVASDRDGLRYSSSGELRRRITARSSMEFRGQYAVASFQSQDLRAVENRRWLGSGTYAYDLTRYLSARLGYGYRSFNTRAEGAAGNHDINVGLLFNRPFRIGTARTVFSFTTGSTILRRERLAGDNPGNSRLVFRGIGTATLAHSFTSAWQGNISYAHSVGYVDGFTEPVEGDRVVASLGGLLTSALDLSFSAGYSSGAIGLRERNFNTTLASARLRYALHSKVALFAQYFYYQYSYADGVAENLLATPELERQGVRAGLTLWLPVMR